MILRGSTDFEFDVENQKTISESMKEFRKINPDFAAVKSVNNCMFGGLPHIELIVR